MLGKLNTHEFAYGALTTSPHFGPARNPWSPDRVCGGSSGGSGAAAAADLAAGTLGTDTAGSIRIPACFCGVTGLRPSLGPRPEPRASSRPRGRSTRSARSRGAPRTAPAPRGARARRTVRHSTAASAISASASSSSSSSAREPAHRRVCRGRRSTSSSRSARASSRSTSRCSSEAGTIAAADHAPRGDSRPTRRGCARGSPTTGPDVRARLLAGLLLPVDRLRRRACGRGAGTCDELAPRVRALRPARRTRDADRPAANRRGDGRRCTGEQVPYRLAADPVQLALGARGRPGRERARAASSTGCPSGSRSSAVRPARRPCSAPRRVPARDGLARAPSAGDRWTESR